MNEIPSRPPRVLHTVFVSLLLLTSSGLSAQGRIENFSVRMALDREGYLTVEESITVDVRGEEVEHYLYRSLTEDLQLPNDDIHELAYEANGVRVERLRDDGSSTIIFRRDDREELIQRQFVIPRIPAGDPTTDLEPGRYTFHFDYRVTAPFREAGDDARMYWPVTGREGWPLDIEHVHIDLKLPQPLTADQIDVVTYDRWPGEGEGVIETETTQVRRKDSDTITIIHDEGIAAGGEFAFSARWPSGLLEPSRIPIDFELIGMRIFGIVFMLAFGAGVFYLVFFILPAGRGGGVGAGPGGGGGGGAGGGGGGG